MPLDPAPIQEPLIQGGRLSPLWVKWLNLLRLAVYRAPVFAVAKLPANAELGWLAYVPDEVGGAVIAFYDGTSWRRCTDRAVVS